MAKKFISYARLSHYDVKIKEYITALLTAANGDITEVKALVDMLIGSDTSKSVRTIANEELAKQLIPENAGEALDTLQEIAAWIQAHPSDVAEINRRINALEAYVGAPANGETPATGLFKAVVDAEAAAKSYADIEVGKEKTRAESAESALDERLSTVESAMGENGSVDNRIAAAKNEAINAAAEDATTKIDTLKNTAVSSTSGEDVKVTLGGTVGTPTVTVELEFATDADIDALFVTES